MRKILLGVAVAALTGAMAVPASAAPGDIAVYELNEPAGATVMNDTSGNGLNGDIGSEVTTGVTYSGATGYRFPRLTPNEPPAHPEHNVLVPHSETLNPGTGDYSVEVRYRTTNSFGNLMQKGQSATKGGYWKIQLPQGEPSCLFRDAEGVTNAARSSARIDDGAWHVIQCKHTAGADGMVELIVDGVKVNQNRGAIGSIGNTQPLSLGGKNDCDQINTTCDYFGGDVDWVKITRPGDGNLLRNASYEVDANGDGAPDEWSKNAKFTRSTAYASDGTYSGRHSATDDTNHTVQQLVTNVAPGASYSLSGQVLIPDTSDAFKYMIKVRWADAGNATLRVDTVKTYTAATSGWDLASATMVAPTGAAKAQVRLIASNLNATVHVDDVALVKH